VPRFDLRAWSRYFFCVFCILRIGGLRISGPIAIPAPIHIDLKQEQTDLPGRNDGTGPYLAPWLHNLVVTVTEYS